MKGGRGASYQGKFKMLDSVKSRRLIKLSSLCLSQVNLIERCLQAQETLIPMGTANGLINPELSPDTMRTLHSARFEFARSEKSTSTFCLNVNFDQDHGAIESGSAQYRWFKTSTEATRQEALQLAMIDFHRYDNFLILASIRY